MRVSIVLMTGREDPHLDWILDGLVTQARDHDEIDLILVDALMSGPIQVAPGAPFSSMARPSLLGERELAIIARRPRLFSRVVATAPKPNAWQGACRLTSCEWWATANARNTALAIASESYVCFLDDRARLGPGWMQALRMAEREHASVLAGAYDKLEGAEDAPAISRDHRLELAPRGRRDCGGGWLYGCSFALPLEWALEVNGFEEGCDGLTGEDYIFGLMLGNRGYRIDYAPAFMVHQDRTRGNESCKADSSSRVGRYKCQDKGTSPDDKSHAALARFGAAKRTTYTPDLHALRRQLRADPGFAWPMPDPEMRDWYDDQPIREL